MTCVMCARTAPRAGRARQRGKSDTLDSERIARETLAHPLLPKAFKRAGQDTGPDQQTELLAVWWTARRSLIKRRQHLLTESEALLRELPLELIERLPSATRVRPRLAALARVTARRRLAPPTAVRVRILSGYREEIANLDAQERQITRQLAELVSQSGSTLGQLCGLATVSVAELLVEVGDPRRFTIGGFGRFNGTAPLAASTAEGPASRSATATTRAVTAASTRSFTGWRSRSCAASRARRRSTLTRAPTDTPKRKLVGSSNAICPTSSSAA